MSLMPSRDWTANLGEALEADEPPALCPGEEVVDDAAQVLWRQVHPDYIDEEIVGRGAFRGVSGDRERVSTSLDGLQTAEGAYRFHVERLQLVSAGTWSVTAGTVAQVGGTTVYDAESECAPDPCPPGHANIDLRSLTEPARKQARARLAAEATDLGCGFRPPGPGTRG